MYPHLLEGLAHYLLSYLYSHANRDTNGRAAVFVYSECLSASGGRDSLLTVRKTDNSRLIKNRAEPQGRTIKLPLKGKVRYRLSSANACYSLGGLCSSI